MKLSSRSPRSLAAFFILIIALAIFGIQLRTLYSVPIFDSVRWGGDESWLMREYVTQLHTGSLVYPEHYGGAVRTNGALAGSMWGNSRSFGMPGILFFPKLDYISIGRTVNAILALVLIGSFYWIARAIGISPLLRSLAIAILVIDQGFVWATHSARYDLLTGLILLWYCYLLSRIETLRLRTMFFAGALGIVLIAFSPHLLTFGFGVSLVLLWNARIWRNTSLFFSWLLGTLIALLFFSILYIIGSEISLFGRGGSQGIFSFVLHDIPILRPFSRNVQISNLLERIHIFATDMPGMLLIVPIVLFIALGYAAQKIQLRRRGIELHVASTLSQRFFLASSVLCLLLWLLTQGSRPYYLFHIVPILLMGSIVVFELWNEVFSKRWFGETGTVAIAILAIALSANHSIPYSAFGNAVARDQGVAISRFLPEAHPQSTPKSRILFDVAGFDRALTDTSYQVLNLDMFQPPPNAQALIQKLNANRIDYVVLRSSPLGTPFEPGRALLPHVLDSIGIEQDSTLGFFYDDGRSYDAGLTELIDEGLDTLRLYRVSP